MLNLHVHVGSREMFAFILSTIDDFCILHICTIHKLLILYYYVQHILHMYAKRQVQCTCTLSGMIYCTACNSFTSILVHGGNVHVHADIDNGSAINTICYFDHCFL